MAGLLDILRGIADQADFVPFFDPDKDRKGLISQLLSGGAPQPGGIPNGAGPSLNEQRANASPMRKASAAHMGLNGAASAPSPMSAPGGAIPSGGVPAPRVNPPMQPALKPPMPEDYTTPLNFLDRLNPFVNTDNIRANDWAKFDYANDRYSAQQALRASQQATSQFRSDLKAAGLSDQQIAGLVASRGLDPEGTGEAIASNYEFQNVSPGHTYSRFGGEMQSAPHGVELTEDPYGRPMFADLDNQSFSDPFGEVAPVTVADGGQLVDPLTGDVQHTNLKDHPPLDTGPDPTKEGVLRREFNGITSTFRDTQESFARIMATDSSTSAGQMSLIFQYMKMLDPGSTVREGEFANAQNTTGIPGHVIILYNKAVAGEFLTDAQITDFQTQATSLYERAAHDYGQRVEQYRTIAEGYGFDAARTIPDVRSQNSGPVRISSDDDYDQLPSGTKFIDPDGNMRVKP